MFLICSRSRAGSNERWKEEKEGTCCPHEVPVSNSVIRKQKFFGEMPGSNAEKPRTQTGRAL